MKFVAAAAIAAAAFSAASAQTPVTTARFDSIELRGGGHVTVRHGSEQRVTLLRGDAATTRFTVDAQGTLRIDACARPCRNYRLELEIVTPDLEAAAIRGGGAIRTEGGFRRRGTFAVAVNGGGSIDADAVEAANVAASIRGGGEIRTHARDSLVASINGGGSIRYRGDPSVTSSINGGGSVAPSR